MAIIGDLASVWKETETCDGCGAVTPLPLLDAKPDESLLCQSCYGPGWVPLGEEPPM